MPRKIRDLIRDLRDAGFELDPKRGKGDHQVWEHPRVVGARVVLDGKGSDDAKPYQEKQVKTELAKIRRAG